MPLGKLGKYERVDVLGHGVSGIVYLAWDTLLKKQIALKEIDLQAADVSRFLEEARVMDRLSHPNIVRVNGVDLIDGRVVIDMEYVKGQNLQQLLRKEHTLSLDRSLSIAIQTLDALDFAHRMRTVHRDIKPANILIGRDDEVKLVDFGLAEILATNSYAGGAGTYAYMAPEDFLEEHHSDHQSDIWAVGVTLYEMLTAARPFNVTRAKDPFAWRKTLLNDDPIPLSDHQPDAPEALQSVIDRALARSKSDRYQTAAEFAHDLRAIQQDPVFSARPVDLPNTQYPSLNGNHPERDQTMLKLPWQLPAESAARTLPLPAPVAVAEPPAAPVAKAARLRGLLARRQAPPLVAVVEPIGIHFGEIRKGDERSGHVVVRFTGGEGKPNAAVVATPAWASVEPMRFNRRRQTLKITVDSEQVWQTGEFQESVNLETDAGPVQIPIAVKVLPARPRFAEVAVWFVPLFFAMLLPALTVANLARVAGIRYLVPSGALSSGLLALMLLLVANRADMGMLERLACGMVMAVMTLILGIALGAAQRVGATHVLTPLAGVGVPIGIMFAVQLFTRRHWRFWAAAIALLGVLSSFAFLLAVNTPGG